MVGIDKIRITTKDFRINKIKEEFWSIDKRNKQGETHIPIIHVDNQGVPLYANKAVRVVEKVGEYAINPYGLQVQFNPSKHHHPYHLIGTGSKFQDSLELIKKDLSFIGLECSLEDMQLSRIDLTDQHEMQFEPSTYNDVFRMFKGKRIRNQKEYPDGFQVGNKQWQTVGYDKLLKLRHDKLSGIIENERNLLRIESKWLTTQYVNRTLPFSNIRKLNDVGNEELFSIYKKHLLNKTFNNSILSEQLKLNLNEQGEILRELINRHKTKVQAALSHFMIIAKLDVDTAILSFGGIDKYRQFLMNEGGLNRSYAYTVVQLIEKFIQDRQTFSSTKDITVTSLLDEIVLKFAA